MDNTSSLKINQNIKAKHPNKVIEFLKGIGTILLFYIFSSIAITLLKNYLYDKNFAIATISQIALYLILLVGLGLIYHKRIINDFKTFKKENTWIAIKNWLIGLTLMFSINIILSLIVKSQATNEIANRTALAAYPISNIITMIFIGPFIEEITFRASFKKAFDKWYTFAIVTAIIFGGVHVLTNFTGEVFEPLQLLYIFPYAALAFFFAKAFYETDNILTSTLAHTIHNAMCIFFIMLY